MNTNKTPPHIKLDEKNHVEEPFLAQLEGLGWEVIRLEQKQSPQDSYRENLAEVVLLPNCESRLKGSIHGWKRIMLMRWSSGSPLFREPDYLRPISKS